MGHSTAGAASDDHAVNESMIAEFDRLLDAKCPLCLQEPSGPIAMMRKLAHTARCSVKTCGFRKVMSDLFEQGLSKVRDYGLIPMMTAVYQYVNGHLDVGGTDGAPPDWSVKGNGGHGTSVEGTALDGSEDRVTVLIVDPSSTVPETLCLPERLYVGLLTTSEKDLKNAHVFRMQPQQMHKWICGNAILFDYIALCPGGEVYTADIESSTNSTICRVSEVSELDAVLRRWADQ